MVTKRFPSDVKARYMLYANVAVQILRVVSNKTIGRIGQLDYRIICCLSQTYNLTSTQV